MIRPHTVKLRLDDDTYKALVAMRLKAGKPNISAFLLHKCGLLGVSNEAAEITRTALLRAKKKPSTEKYRLRELFKPEEWDGFSNGARISAGKLFADKVAQAVDGIRATTRSSANHQFYMTSKKS